MIFASNLSPTKNRFKIIWASTKAKPRVKYVTQSSQQHPTWTSTWGKFTTCQNLSSVSLEFWSFFCTANYPHAGASMKPGSDQEQLEFDEFVSANTQKHAGGAKSIQCLLCSKVTIHVGNMKQHFEVHHFRRFYKCPVCHRDCKTRNCLSVHRKNYGHWIDRSLCSVIFCNARQ